MSDTIAGYRELSGTELDLINQIKDVERDVASLVRNVMTSAYLNNEGARQAAIARTEFEAAFMRLVRSVAQPVSPWAAQP